MALAGIIILFEAFFNNNNNQQTERESQKKKKRRNKSTQTGNKTRFWIHKNLSVMEHEIELDIFEHLLNESRKKQEFIDVQLQIGSKLFDAHRVVLSLYSPVLKTMLSDQWATTKICPISEKHIDPEIVEDLLNFLYIGRIKLTPDNVHPVCAAAHFLQISILLEPAERYLCKLITGDNLLELLVFSFTRNLKNLRICCFRFITESYENFFNDPQFLELSFDNFKQLIVGLREPLCESVPKEDVFHCIVRWIEEKDVPERSEHLPILLKSIPLHKLSKEFLEQTVNAHPLVKASTSAVESFFDTSDPETALNVQAEHRLIVLGGEDTQGSSCGELQASMSRLDDYENEVWKALPEMTHPRSHFAAVVVNQRDIVICGGFIEADPKQITDSVEMFDWAKQSWVELPALPHPVSGLSIAVLDGHLYITGGKNDHEERLATVLCYSFETEQWKKVTPMNFPQANGQLISYKLRGENFLYAFDGESNTVEKYDPVLDEWTVVRRTDSKSGNVAATLHQGKIYVGLHVEHISDTYHYSSEIKLEVFDPENNTWTELGDPIQGDSTVLVSLNGKLLAIGGNIFDEYDDQKYYYDYHDMSNKVRVYDFDTQRWGSFNWLELETGLEFHCAVTGVFY